MPISCSRPLLRGEAGTVHLAELLRYPADDAAAEKDRTGPRFVATLENMISI